MKRIIWLLSRSVLSFALLAGCSGGGLPSLDLAQIQSTATTPPTAVVVTATATDEPAPATPVSTAAPEPTLTAIPAASPTPTAAATATATATQVVAPQVVAVAQSSAAPAASAAPATSAGVIAALQGTLENIYAEVAPSVVKLDVVENPANLGRRFRNSAPPQGVGSGFVWDQAGHIVTNNHVVANAASIVVTFADGSSAPATLVATDPDTDLAVVKVEMPASALQPVQMADSTKVKVGQLAIAIGNPFGEQGTMTTGIISALSRSVSANSSAQGGPNYTVADLIQTDAPINPGNSGGVLLNADGQVIGVTSAIESNGQTSSGIGFAIPSMMVNKVVPALLTTGHYDRAWLGVSGTSLTSQLAKEMNLPTTQRGALVENVVASSPAGKAGLQGGSRTVTVDNDQITVGGDVIVAIDNQPVKEWGTLITYLAHNTTPGQTANLTVLRQGKEERLQVALATRPSAQSQTY